MQCDLFTSYSSCAGNLWRLNDCETTPFRQHSYEFRVLAGENPGSQKMVKSIMQPLYWEEAYKLWKTELGDKIRNAAIFRLSMELFPEGYIRQYGASNLLLCKELKILVFFESELLKLFMHHQTNLVLKLKSTKQIWDRLSAWIKFSFTNQIYLQQEIKEIDSTVNNFYFFICYTHKAKWVCWKNKLHVQLKQSARVD